MTTVKVFKPGTNLRTGGSTRGPNNVIKVLHDPREYEALEQCAGQDVSEGADFNFWWVRIRVSDDVTGWVSAVRIQGGGNDEPIDGVPQRSTRFCTD